MILINKKLYWYKIIVNKQKKMNLFIYRMYFLSQHQILMLTLNYFEIFKKMV